MKQKFFKTLSAVAVAVVCALSLFGLTSCASTNPSDTSYWFSSNSYQFVAYDEGEDNLSQAGSYWNFTSAVSGNVTLSVRINVGLYSAAYLYLNDVQVQSQPNTGIYSYVYNLTLNKGDRIKLHAFWVNSLMSDDTGFEITLLTMEKDGKSHILKEFDKTTTV